MREGGPWVILIQRPSVVQRYVGGGCGGGGGGGGIHV